MEFKKVIVEGLDGKERMLVFQRDGEIDYCSIKNGLPHGKSFVLNESKLPKWINSKMLEHARQ